MHAAKPTHTSPISLRCIEQCKLSAIAALVTTAVFASGQAGAAPPSRSSEGPWAKARVLVMPKPGLSEIELDKIAALHGGKAIRLGNDNLHVIELPPQSSETAALARLKSNPNLKFAELDRSVPPSLVANDPYAGSAWHIPKVGASKAWDSTQGAGIVIAVLDTGVYGAHVDLAANMVPGWNVFNNNADTSDFYGHGTPVSGTAAAITNNGTGVVGVAGRAKIMPLVVTDSTGASYYSVISQAITYAADHGARVASISFSGLPFSSAVQSAAQYMKNKGGLVVVAAGNTGAVDNTAPTTTMITVASTEADDSRTTTSTFGAFVTMSAPGTNIYSTSRSGGYGIYGGTSFSTPIVAGTVALMMAANPKLLSADLESLLYKTAVDLGTAGRDPYFGYGRVDTAAAVSAAITATPTSSNLDSSPPQTAISAPLANATVSGLVGVNVNASDNIGVSRVELRVNGALLATDTSSPFAFSWDSTKVSNGMANLVATGYDAAGNAGSSTTVAVNVSNITVSTDTTAPIVTIVSPVLSSISGNSMTVSDSASDNSGAAALSQKLYINSKLVASAKGATLSYNWSTRNLKAGAYTLQFVASDAAGNTTTVSKQITK